MVHSVVSYAHKEEGNPYNERTVQHMYISRKELESILGVKFTDEQWKENERIISDLEDKAWEEDHPLDE